MSNDNAAAWNEYRGMRWRVEQARVVIESPSGALMATWQSSCSVDADTARAEGWIDGWKAGKR